MRGAARWRRLPPGELQRYAARLQRLYPTLAQRDALREYLRTPSTRRQYIVDSSIDQDNNFTHQPEQVWRATRLELARRASTASVCARVASMR